MTKTYSESRIPELEEACRLRPNSLMVADLAACYFTLNRPHEALPLAQQAWAKNKKPGIAMNLALILKDLGRHDESARVIEEAYQLDPDDFYVRLGYGESLLKNGHWKQAWPIYDSTRPTQAGACFDLRLPRTVKEWQIDEKLPEGHTLLVINEGGVGDRLSYARWLPELTKRGINWKFYPYAELYPIFERIFPRENLVKDGDDVKATHWATSFSLPAKLNIGPTEIPEPLLLTATPESIAKFKIGKVDNFPLVGLCYQAAEKFQGDRRVRSLTQGQAMRLVTMTGDKIHWVSLQKDDVLPRPVTNLRLDTWDDTIGLMQNLDAVVSVDTAVMHMAGAMRKPMAVILSANACWKFLRRGRKLKLYPGATFYRNIEWGVEDAIDELIQAIRSGNAW